MLFLPFRVILSSQLELSLFILSGAGLKKQEMGLEPGSEFNSALSYALSPSTKDNKNYAKSTLNSELR